MSRTPFWEILAEAGVRTPYLWQVTAETAIGDRDPCRPAPHDDLLEVQAGFMKMQVSRDDVLEVLPEGGPGARLPKGVSFQSGPEVCTSMREINVIGNRADEAIEKVDKFLDSAVLAGVNRIRIVHGFGMGVLRRAITELLAKNPNVEKFYAASQSEGGGGATIVELKE